MFSVKQSNEKLSFESYKKTSQTDVYLIYNQLIKEIDTRISYYKTQGGYRNPISRRELTKLELLKKQVQKNFNNNDTK